MKKLLLISSVIWLFILMLGFVAYQQVLGVVTQDFVRQKLDALVTELDLDIEATFGKYDVSLGTDIRLHFQDIEVSSQKKPLLNIRQLTLKVPHLLFFTDKPSDINVQFDGVYVPQASNVRDWFENYLRRRKRDQNLQAGVPRHFIESRYHFRFYGITISSGGSVFPIEKMVLHKGSPGGSSAFEVVFPSTQEVANRIIQWSPVLLGEYRINGDKIDLHYVLKSRVNWPSGSSTRHLELVFEGKGFLHPRMGLMGTINGKDESLGFVADIEWNAELFKLQVPKFNLMTDILFDFLPFNEIKSPRPMAGTSRISGQGSWQMAAGRASLFGLTLNTKTPYPVELGGKVDNLNLSLDLSSESTEFHITGPVVGDLINLEQEKSGWRLIVSPMLTVEGIDGYQQWLNLVRFFRGGFDRPLTVTWNQTQDIQQTVVSRFNGSQASFNNLRIFTDEPMYGSGIVEEDKIINFKMPFMAGPSGRTIPLIGDSPFPNSVVIESGEVSKNAEVVTWAAMVRSQDIYQMVLDGIPVKIKADTEIAQELSKLSSGSLKIEGLKNSYQVIEWKLESDSGQHSLSRTMSKKGVQWRWNLRPKKGKNITKTFNEDVL